jgi:hypothetical protein
MTSKLVDGIRAKYATPQAALKALGLDTTLLDDPGNRPVRSTQRKRNNTRLRQHLDEMISLVDLLGADENPTMKEEEASSERNAKFDPRGSSGSGEIEGGRERKGEDDFEVPASGSAVSKEN